MGRYVFAEYKVEIFLAKFHKSLEKQFLEVANNKKYYGTGSYPLPPQGLQRSIRFIVSHNPLNGPCF